MKQKYFYFGITTDEFEYPMTPVFDTMRQLADYLKKPYSSIRTMISRNEKDYARNCYYIKVKRI